MLGQYITRKHQTVENPPQSKNSHSLGMRTCQQKEKEKEKEKESITNRSV